MGQDMDTSLLATKLHFPLVRHSFVSRPRLVANLNQGFHSSLTLISGSAGSGKTTLLSEWYAQAGGNVPAAWFSLDERDNDLQGFLAYLSASLDGIQPGLRHNIQAILESPQVPQAEIILTALINALSTIPTDFVLVLDDYHVITAPEIHAAVSFLVENMPYQMHLVILTRVDPPLPLARLRSRGKLVELRDRELRFTLEETASFLRQVMQLPVSDAHVASLGARTEGWAAGLQMAALSMAHQADLDAFIHNFTGSHRYLMDYLVEEVLQQQPEEVQAFLEKTSILDRFTASLCAAVTGYEDSQRIVSYLDKANLFLVPLDEQREWYRYHHLFAELLRHRLRQTGSMQFTELYQRASDWCAQNDLANEAIDYALLGNDFTRAARLIQTEILVKLVVPIRWLRAVPAEVMSQYPAILTAQSSHALLSHLRDASSMKTPLEMAEEAIRNLPADAPQRDLIEAHWLITNAMIGVEQYELTASIAWIDQAQALLPEDALALWYYAKIALSQAARNLGENQAALQAAIDAERIARQAGLTARAYIAVTMLTWAIWYMSSISAGRRWQRFPRMRLWPPSHPPWVAYTSTWRRFFMSRTSWTRPWSICAKAFNCFV